MSVSPFFVVQVLKAARKTFGYLNPVEDTRQMVAWRHNMGCYGHVYELY